MFTATRMATDPADVTETSANSEGNFSAWTVEDRTISTSQNNASSTDFHAQFEQDGVAIGVLVVVGLVLTIFILAAIVGNALVIAAVVTERSLWRPGNNFLISLAAADALVACLVMTFAAVNDLTNRWSFGAVWCIVWTSSDVMCCTASILNICAVSLDRYVHVRDPLRYRSLVTHRRSLVAVAVIWTMSAVISFLPISLGWHRLGKTANNETHPYHHHHHLWLSSSSSNDNYSTTTTIDWVSNSSIHLLLDASIDSRTGELDESAGECHLDLNPWYACISSLISFYIPCAVMLVIYARLYRLSMKHRKSIISNTADAQKKPRPPKIPTEEDLDDMDDCSLAHEQEQESRPNTKPRQDHKLPNGVSSATTDTAGGRKRVGSFNFQMVPVVTISNCSPDGGTNRGGRRFSDNSILASGASDGVSPCRRLGADLLPPTPQRRTSTASVRLMISRPSMVSVSSFRQTDHKAAITVGCIIGIFLFCWGPFFVINIIGTVWEGSIPPVAFTFFTWLGYINSSVNPVIYGVTNVEFRRAFLRILTSHCHSCHSCRHFDRRQDWNDNNNSYRQVRTIN